jgi:hypothetical protein
MSKKIIFVTEDMIQQVQTQTNASVELAKSMLIETNGNITDTILKLLDIPIENEKPNKTSGWEERRKICNEMEEEMYNYIHRCGTVNYNAKNEVIRTIPKPSQKDLKGQAPHH